MIALIKDAPISILIATIISALAALAILEMEAWLTQKHRSAFTVSVFVVSVIYLGFVGFAIGHAIQREAANRGLIQKYESAAPLFKQGKSLIEHHLTSADAEFLKSIDQFHEDYDQWGRETSEWLVANLGNPASEQFLDMSTLPTYCWGPPMEGCNIKLSGTYNALINAKKNLAIIMQNRGVSF